MTVNPSGPTEKRAVFISLARCSHVAMYQGNHNIHSPDSSDSSDMMSLNFLKNAVGLQSN